MSARTESSPPPGALKLHEAWKAFFERYWGRAEPLVPRPEGMSLKVRYSGSRAIGAILWNPLSGKFLVRSYGKSAPALTFPISYVIKDSDKEITHRDVINVNFCSVAKQVVSHELEDRILVPRRSRLEFLTGGAPEGFSYSIRSGLDVLTTEQQKWEDEKFDRNEEAGKVFADAFRNGELEVFFCLKTASGRQLDQLDPAAWGAEATDGDQSMSSSACLARCHLLSQDKIKENDLPSLSDWAGLTPYVFKSKFNRWLEKSPRHKSPAPGKIDSNGRILECHWRFYSAVKALRLSLPLKISVALAVGKVLKAERQAAFEAIGWGERIMRQVLSGRHGPSNKLVRDGRLSEWWSGAAWSGNLPKQ
jgi:hypothetical protein